MGKTRDKLTAKQRNFARAVVAEGNQAEAYRQAYKAQGSTNETVRSEASRLMADPHIAATVQKEQDKASQRLDVTVDSLTDKLRETYDDAKDHGQHSVQVASIMGQAKLHGLLVDRTEDVSKAQDMTAVELEGELERLQDELDALQDAPTADLPANGSDQ